MAIELCHKVTGMEMFAFFIYLNVTFSCGINFLMQMLFPGTAYLFDRVVRFLKIQAAATGKSGGGENWYAWTLYFVLCSFSKIFKLSLLRLCC